jgi:hypothetical protein
MLLAEKLGLEANATTNYGLQKAASTNLYDLIARDPLAQATIMECFQMALGLLSLVQLGLILVVVIIYPWSLTAIFAFELVSRCPVPLRYGVGILVLYWQAMDWFWVAMVLMWVITKLLSTIISALTFAKREHCARFGITTTRQ